MIAGDRIQNWEGLSGIAVLSLVFLSLSVSFNPSAFCLWVAFLSASSKLLCVGSFLRVSGTRSPRAAESRLQTMGHTKEILAQMVELESPEPPADRRGWLPHVFPDSHHSGHGAHRFPHHRGPHCILGMLDVRARAAWSQKRTVPSPNEERTLFQAE